MLTPQQKSNITIAALILTASVLLLITGFVLKNTPTMILSIPGMFGGIFWLNNIKTK